MKKVILLSMLISVGITLTGYSQEAPETETAVNEELYGGTHELKINAAYLLGGIPDVSYEYILSGESSLGISVAFPLERDIFYNFLAVPYYRLFFGKKRAAGFFIEGNGAVFSETYYRSIWVNGNIIEDEKISNVGGGLGLAIGGKFLTKSGWVGEIFGGAGRNFFHEDNDFSPVYPRFGINIGKRF